MSLEGIDAVEEELAEDESLLAKLISLGSMERSVRWVTVAAIVLALAAAGVTALQAAPLHLPRSPLYEVGNVLVTAPVAVTVFAVILVGIAWSCVLGGALHAHWLARVCATGAFSALVWTNSLSALSGPTAAAAVLLLAAVWVITFGSLAWDGIQKLRGAERSKRHDEALLIPTLAGVALSTLGLYCIAYFGTRSSNAHLLFTTSFSLELTIVGIFMVPLLYLTGVDFAEWGSVLAERAVRLLSRQRKSSLLPMVAGGVALAGILFFILPGIQHPVDLAASLGLGVLVAVLFAGALRLLGKLHLPAGGSVPYQAVVIAVLVFYGTSYGAAYVHASKAQSKADSAAQGLAASMGEYSYSGPPAFSMLEPALWETTVPAREGVNGAAFTVVQFDGKLSADPAAAFLFIFPPAVAQDETAAVSGVLDALAGPSRILSGEVAYLSGVEKEHGWTRYTVGTAALVQGTALSDVYCWSRQEGGYIWVLVGVSNSAVGTFNAPGFTAMADSWHPHAASVHAAGGGTSAESPGAVLLPGLLALILLAILGIAYVRFSRSRSRKKLVHAGTQYVVLTLLLFAAAGCGYLAELETGGSTLGWLSLRLSDIVWLCCGATLLAVAAGVWGRWAFMRNWIGPLLELDAALLLISVVYNLYSGGSAVSHFSIAQAVILLIAFALDLAFSGERITNVHSRSFPRHSRVLMFLGFILMGTALVLYFSSLHYQASGAAVSSQFEKESYPQDGLVFFGLPIVLMAFLARISAAGNGAEGEKRAEVAQ